MIDVFVKWTAVERGSYGLFDATPVKMEGRAGALLPNRTENHP